MKTAVLNGNLILCEYPFLEDFIEQFCAEYPHVRNIQIEEIDLPLLREIPFTLAWSYLNKLPGLVPSLKKYYLLDETGEVLCKVAENDHTYRGSKRRFLVPTTWWRRRVEGEQVGDAISSLENPNEIRYVVEITAEGQPRKSVTGASLIRVESEIILYKVPEGKTLSEHICELQRK